VCRGVTGYLKKLKEFLNSPAGKKAEEEDGIGYSRICVCLCRGVTGYLKKLKEFLNSPAGKKAEEEDVKIKQIALRSTENLQVTSYQFSGPRRYTVLKWIRADRHNFAGSGSASRTCRSGSVFISTKSTVKHML
jgi:hypothetical protein